MKKLLELLLCFIHPVAVILMWVDLATRTDMGTGAKLAWGIFGLIPLVPFLYVLTGGDLWCPGAPAGVDVCPRVCGGRRGF